MKYYQSLTMGNLVEKITGKNGVIYQMFESLFKYYTFDFKWTICRTNENEVIKNEIYQ